MDAKYALAFQRADSLEGYDRPIRGYLHELGGIVDGRDGERPDATHGSIQSSKSTAPIQP